MNLMWILAWIVEVRKQDINSLSWLHLTRHYKFNEFTKDFKRLQTHLEDN